VTGQKKVIEVYFGSFQYKNPDESVYYRDSEWEKATKDHYSKYGFSTLFLNMDSAGFPEGQTGSDYISMARKEKLLSMVGNFVHNGDQIISIEKKVHKSKKVYNLECSPHKNFFANRLLSHNCDSQLQMKNFTEYSPADLVSAIEKQFGEDYMNKIFIGDVRIVVTGGEPALYAEPLIQFLNMMDKLSASYQLQVLKLDKNMLRPPIYEVETNGTVFTGSQQFYERFSFVNCSPKLSSSGMAKDKRIVPFALVEITKHPYSSFKFVISKDDDWNEIRKDFIDTGYINVHPTRIFLMPAGQTKEDLEETRKVCWRMAEATGCLMTSRLQIETWGMRPGI
jgi:6-pyruvoyltetrahydropterin 2'-reductase